MAALEGKSETTNAIRIYSLETINICVFIAVYLSDKNKGEKTQLFL